MLEKIFRSWDVILSYTFLILVVTVVAIAWYELGTSIRYSRIFILLEKVYLGEELSPPLPNIGNSHYYSFSSNMSSDSQLDYNPINTFLFYSLPVLKIILLTITITSTRLLSKGLANQFDVPFFKYILTALYPRNLKLKHQVSSGVHLLIFWLGASSIILIVASWL